MDERTDHELLLVIATAAAEYTQIKLDLILDILGEDGEEEEDEADA